jgi:hypothetical protein
LRIFVLAAAGAQTAFWFYTFRFVHVNANPMGDGLEWTAALLLGTIGRFLRFGALLASAGLAFNIVVFLQIVREMTSHAAHHLRF